MAVVETITASTEQICFICDTTITGKRHQLSDYKLKYSKKEIFEALGSIVGDKYVVICQAGDVICQSCVSVLETLDKLENETAAAKRLVLRFLDKKYSLDNGSQSSETEPTVSPEEEVEEKVPVEASTFAARKRKALENLEQVSHEIAQASDDPRSRIWLKCDTCHYTTNYTSFVQRHIRNVSCPHCDAPMQDGVCSLRCTPRRVIAPDLKVEDPPPEDQETPILLSSFLEDQNVLVSNEEEDETPLQGQISIPEVEEELESPANEKRTLYFQVFDGAPKDGNAVREMFTVAHEEADEMWDEESDQPAELV